MTHRKEITVIMITHKFREVTSFCDSVTVLRRGRKVGGGEVKDLTTDADGAHDDRRYADPRARRCATPSLRATRFWSLSICRASDDEGLLALDQVNLKVHSGEIVGIAGVSGNGQSELVEVLSGQRPRMAGRIMIKQPPVSPRPRLLLSSEDFRASRGAIARTPPCRE